MFDNLVSWVQRHRGKLECAVIVVLAIMAAVFFIWALFFDAPAYGAEQSSRPPAYYRAATRSSANDAEAILQMIERGDVSIEGASRGRVIQRLQTIRNR